MLTAGDADPTGTFIMLQDIRHDLAPGRAQAPCIRCPPVRRPKKKKMTLSNVHIVVPYRIIKHARLNPKMKMHSRLWAGHPLWVPYCSTGACLASCPTLAFL